MPSAVLARTAIGGAVRSRAFRYRSIDAKAPALALVPRMAGLRHRQGLLPGIAPFRVDAFAPRIIVRPRSRGPQAERTINGGLRFATCACAQSSATIGRPTIWAGGPHPGSATKGASARFQLETKHRTGASSRSSPKMKALLVIALAATALTSGAPALAQSYGSPPSGPVRPGHGFREQLEGCCQSNGNSSPRRRTVPKASSRCHLQCVNCRILWTRLRRISLAIIGPNRFHHLRRWCQSNGNLSPRGRTEPKPDPRLGEDCLPGSQCSGSSLLVDFPTDEVALLGEVVVD